MARLSEITSYKNLVGFKLLESMDICKALKYSNRNFLDQSDLEDTSELIYQNIFPYRFIPEVSEEMKTYITMFLGNFSSINNSFKSGMLRINVFTHRDLFRTDYGFTRVDFIANKIDELFNQQRGLGLGKLEFHGLDDIVVNDKYQGLVITYKILEFN